MIGGIAKGSFTIASSVERSDVEDNIDDLIQRIGHRRPNNPTLQLGPHTTRSMSIRIFRPGTQSSPGAGSQQDGMDAYFYKQHHDMQKLVTELQKNKANMAMANNSIQYSCRTLSDCLKRDWDHPSWGRFL